MSSKANSTFAESELKNHPIDDTSVLKMIPKIEIDSKNKTFHVEIDIPGFSNDEIEVSVNEGQITIDAVSKNKSQNLDLCKAHKVSFYLPANHIIKDLRKVLEKGELKLKGTLL